MRKNHRRWIGGALLLALLTGIVGAPAFAPLQAQDGNTTPTSVPEVPVDDVLNAQFDTIQRQVENLRQLSPAIPVTRRLVNGDVMQTLLFERATRTYTLEQSEEDELFYRTFGLSYFQTPLWELMLAEASKQVETFYSPDNQTLWILNGGVFDAYREVVYGNAYTSALLDQNFPPESSLPLSFDEALARQALRAGDAQLVTEQHTQLLLNEAPETALSFMANIARPNPAFPGELPLILVNEVLFVNDSGLQFVRALYERNSNWSEVNAAYDNPPRSTEQILHPEKYISGDAPRQVRLNRLDSYFKEIDPDSTWRLAFDQTLGEFYLRQHLILRMQAPEVEGMASGWGGDRFLLYVREQDGATVLVWKSVWDTVVDAREFGTLYGGYLGLWLNALGSFANASVSCWQGERQSACKRESDTEVLIVIAPTSQMTQAIIDLQQPSQTIFG